MKERISALCQLTWTFYSLDSRAILTVSTVWNTGETGDINFFIFLNCLSGQVMPIGWIQNLLALGMFFLRPLKSFFYIYHKSVQNQFKDNINSTEIAIEFYRLPSNCWPWKPSSWRMLFSKKMDINCRCF